MTPLCLPRIRTTTITQGHRCQRPQFDQYHTAGDGIRRCQSRIGSYGFFDNKPPSRFCNERVRAIAEEAHRKRGLHIEKSRRKEEEVGGEDVSGQVVEECGLRKIDDQFIKSFAASLGLAVPDAEALVRALRK